MGGGITLPSHTKKHKIDSTRDHGPIAGAVENEIVTIDANGLPVKKSGIQIGDILGGLIPQGDWAASTNTPALVNGTGTIGHFYTATDAGTVDFGAGPITFEKNDYVIYVSGNIWTKQDNTDQVLTVEGRIGDILLKDNDIYMDGKDIILSRYGYALDWGNNPPLTPTEGMIYIVGKPASGDFAGHDDDIAIYRSGSWVFFTPKDGYTYYLTSPGREYLLHFDGTDWQNLSWTIDATLIKKFAEAINGNIYDSDMWAKKVAIDIQSTPPASPNTGDTYIIDKSPTGDWVGKEDQIVTYTGSWSYKTPSIMDCMALENIDDYYIYDGTRWKSILESIGKESKQAIGYYVSDIRGNDTTGDGSLFNPFKTPNTAIAKGIANGDASIALILDTRGNASYNIDIPANQVVSIVGDTGIISLSGYISAITLGDGCTCSIDNMYIVNIKEAAGITSATIYVNGSSIIGGINDSGIGYATKTTGHFFNTLVNSTTIINDINNMLVSYGILISLKAGAERSFALNGLDANGEKLSNLAEPTAAQDAVTKNYVDTGLGTHFQAAALDGEANTTNTAFQQRLRMTTPNLPVGNYIIEWYCEIKSSTGSGDDVEVQVQLNDTTVLGNVTNGSRWIGLFSASSDYQGESGIYIANGLSGIQNIDMDYKTNQGTAYIRRARLTIRRVS